MDSGYGKGMVCELDGVVSLGFASGTSQTLENGQKYLGGTGQRTADTSIGLRTPGLTPRGVGPHPRARLPGVGTHREAPGMPDPPLAKGGCGGGVHETRNRGVHPTKNRPKNKSHFLQCTVSRAV